LPATFLHHPAAYIIYRIDKRLNLPGLIVGAMLPDLEIPFIVISLGTNVPNRMILHSLLGSATLGTLIGIIITTQLYPYFITRFFGVNEKKIKNKCKFSRGLLLSVTLGAISHVLLDVLNHPYNPIFWPFQSAIETPNTMYFEMGEIFGSLWIQIVLGVLLLVLIIIKRKNLIEDLLVE
jgi:membrane-bound metal-dependent hydrolase YbcI (DUF457 family)